jgi:hypothetical protein
MKLCGGVGGGVWVNEEGTAEVINSQSQMCSLSWTRKYFSSFNRNEFS